MKQSTKWLATALAVAGGLAVPSPLKASNVTLSDFSNFNFSATYANWDAVGSQIISGGSGYTPTLTSGPTSFRVLAQGYGSAAYDLPSPIDATGATGFALTFTINHTMVHPDTTGLWFGPNITISDGTHQVPLTALNPGLANVRSYGPYVGPGTYTLFGNLGDLNVANVTAFNLEVDPAEYGGGAPYDITYDHFELTGIPEPTTFALAGLGFAGLLITRRFKK